MINELDEVVLTVDMPGQGLQAGDIGVVVLVHGGGKGYEVEFSTVRGETLAVISVYPEQIRMAQDNEIPHVRFTVLDAGRAG